MLASLEFQRRSLQSKSRRVPATRTRAGLQNVRQVAADEPVAKIVPDSPPDPLEVQAREKGRVARIAPKCVHLRIDL